MTSERAEELLTTIERSLIGKAATVLTEGKAWPSGLVLVGETLDQQEMIGTLSILDLQQRFTTIRTAVVKERAEGYVFAFDGFIESAQQRLDAVLIIVATPITVRGSAVPYRRTVEGTLVYPTVTPPPDLLTAYQQVFFDAPLVPGSDQRQ